MAWIFRSKKPICAEVWRLGLPFAICHFSCCIYFRRALKPCVRACTVLLVALFTSYSVKFAFGFRERLLFRGFGGGNWAMKGKYTVQVVYQSFHVVFFFCFFASFRLFDLLAIIHLNHTRFVSVQIISLCLCLCVSMRLNFFTVTMIFLFYLYLVRFFFSSKSFSRNSVWTMISRACQFQFTW